MNEVYYNDQMEAGDQADAEEHISAAIFDRQGELKEGARFSREACDRLGFEILCGVLARFPTGYEVGEEDFKRFTSEIAATIFDRQGKAKTDRVFSEEDCNRLGREILAVVIEFFRPDLIIDPTSDRAEFSAARMTRTLNAYASLHGDHEPQAIVPDVLADLMHFCDRQGISFDDLLDTARSNYEAETAERVETVRA